MNGALVATLPQIGMIVEGDGEFHNMPSLLSRALGCNLHIKVSNAHGSGNIRKRLCGYLTDLVKLHSPYWVIIVLDKCDAMASGDYEKCSDIVDNMTVAAYKFIEEVRDNPAFPILPEGISVVIEVPKFESWLIADWEGLGRCEFINQSICRHDYQNVDDVGHPDKWLREKCCIPRDIKGTEFVRKVVSCIDVTVARRRSPSLDKLCREAEKAYDKWMTDLNNS